MQDLRVGLDQSTAIVCENPECDKNETFNEVVYLRKISKLLTGQAEDAIVPIPTFQCTKCGHVNEQFKLKMIK